MKNMIETLTNVAELQAYATAQSKTILQLSKTNKEQADEIIHLKKLLEGSVPLIKDKKENQFEANDQEYICRTEINKLRDISTERELTLEECKKLDIYSKILKDLANAPKTIEVQAKTMDTAALLSIVESD